MAISNWQALEPAQLWAMYRKQHEYDTLAVAQAVWVANRMVKPYPNATRQVFYAIKDEFIRRHQEDLVVGRVVRRDCKPCPSCDGRGYFEEVLDNGVETTTGCGNSACNQGDVCRVLYLHELRIAGVPYRFHSYVKPVIINGEAPDREHFGKPFTEAELRKLPMPFEGYLKVLEHVRDRVWRGQETKDIVAPLAQSDRSRHTIYC